MLKQRLLTALVLIPLFIGAVLYASTATLAWLFGVIILLGAWEWSGLSGMASYWLRLLYCTMVSAGLLIGYHWLVAGTIYTILYTASLFWAGATIWIATINRAPERVQKPLAKPTMFILGIVILVPAWLAVMQIFTRPTDGVWTLLILFMLIWGADTGAYFTGRRWGKHKLAANVSPGKTWQGVAGGLVLAILIVLPIATVNSLYSPDRWVFFLGVCLLTLLISVSGDLLESVMKRKAGVKDSGSLLPGHGGILDRIDSLTAAAPVFASGLHWLESMS